MSLKNIREDIVFEIELRQSLIYSSLRSAEEEGDIDIGIMTRDAHRKEIYILKQRLKRIDEQEVE